MKTTTSVNTPRTLTLAGQDYTVSGLTQAEWGPVQAWIEANVTSPAKALDAFNLDALSPYAARMFADVALKAQQAWPPRVGSPAWYDAMSGVGKNGQNGNAVFLLAVIGKHRPGFTYAEAEALYEALGPVDVLPLYVVAMGYDPNDIPKLVAALSESTRSSRGTGTTSGRRSGSSRRKPTSGSMTSRTRKSPG